MTQEEALRKLSTSLFNLQQRKGQLTLAQVEAEVINLSCLEILKTRQHLKMVEITEMFSRAAQHLIPQYTTDRAGIAQFAVMQNLGWDGMWEFLKNYFQSNHGFSIDGDESSETRIFYSSRHERYEMNKQVANTPAERTIDLFFSEERKVIVVNIQPTLSAKKGYLTENKESKLIYKGSDPDYRFTVILDEIDEVEKFILEMPNRNLRIEYF